MGTKDYKLYDLTLSQEVERLQLKYSLDKKIINIMMSATSDKEIDLDIMEEALRITFDRNDFAKIRFVKHKGQLMQYFDKDAKLENIPRIKFSTDEEFQNFIKQQSKKAIRYMKGEVFIVYLCKTPQNKDMIFIKICHYISDMYGLNVYFKDLFEVYEALKNKQPLPEKTVQFEEMIKKDLDYKNNSNIDEKNRKFFLEYYNEREEPYYAGLHGQSIDIAKKEFDSHTMKMFLLNNQTQSYKFDIDSMFGTEIIKYCESKKVSPANFLYYACSLTQSKINNDIPNILQLELCNCRATAMEKNCVGTKVQSLGCYIEIRQDVSVAENFKQFCSNQNVFYRHLGFSDVEFQMLTHKIWKAPVFKTYYAMTFSFIPFKKPNYVDFQMYSNGKFPLPVYFAILYDVNTHSMQMVYDCQIKLFTKEIIETFHNNYMSVIRQILQNENQLVKDIKVKKD